VATKAIKTGSDLWFCNTSLSAIKMIKAIYKV
jgi:hypothetical protein